MKLPFPNELLEALLPPYQIACPVATRTIEPLLGSLVEFTYMFYKYELPGDRDLLLHEGYQRALKVALIWRKENGQAFAFIQRSAQNRMRDESRKCRRDSGKARTLLSEAAMVPSHEAIHCFDTEALDGCCALSSAHAAAVFALVQEIPTTKYRLPVKRIRYALDVCEATALKIVSDFSSACR